MNEETSVKIMVALICIVLAPIIIVSNAIQLIGLLITKPIWSYYEKKWNNEEISLTDFVKVVMRCSIIMWPFMNNKKVISVFFERLEDKYYKSYTKHVNMAARDYRAYTLVKSEMEDQ